MIMFNAPIDLEAGIRNMAEAISVNKHINGDGPFTAKCTRWLEEKFHTKVLLTTSCTHALEMAALLADIHENDEVIMPSYTFVSTANAFALRGAKIIFVDIRPDTMNIDERLIEHALTRRTRAIVPVHYAGVGCEMDAITALAKKYQLLVIEDAAQAMMASYKGNYLGTIGDYGTYSFHETKNYTMGEGGLICLNRQTDLARAEILREKGTDRSRYFRGEVDKYSWVALGSSYLPSELNAAYLLPQLEIAEAINRQRLALWQLYHQALSPLADTGKIELPVIPPYCQHNAHMYYIKARDQKERASLINYLARHGIAALFHYIPLHTSAAGKTYGAFAGRDVYTTKESERLLRLPMYYALSRQDVEYVADTVSKFYREEIR